MGGYKGGGGIKQNDSLQTEVGKGCGSETLTQNMEVCGGVLIHLLIMQHGWQTTKRERTKKERKKERKKQETESEKE